MVFPCKLTISPFYSGLVCSFRYLEYFVKEPEKFHFDFKLMIQLHNWEPSLLVFKAQFIYLLIYPFPLCCIQPNCIDIGYPIY